ncbi:hypothetical protein Chor_008270 [Crotalus horridus]
MKPLVLLLLLLAFVGQASLSFVVPEKEKDPHFWRLQARETLQRALSLQKLNTNVARNIILFLGDGGWCKMAEAGCPLVFLAREGDFSRPF